MLLFIAGGCMKPSIARLSTGAEVELPGLIEDIKDKRLIFTGEFHTSKENHEAQLNVIRGLNESGVRVAVGLEMFRADGQNGLERWVKGEASEAEFKKIYGDNWGVGWSYYRDIFVYAREHGIPMVGLNVSRGVMRKILHGGLKSLTLKEAEELPPDIKCEMDSGFMELMREALKEHKDMGVSLTNFCEAQTAWDAAMASNAVKFLKANPDKVMVVLAGSVHAWRKGIPLHVSRRSDAPYVIIMPESLEANGIGVLTVQDADYAWRDDWGERKPPWLGLGS